jgi:hypothetical protein
MRDYEPSAAEARKKAMVRAQATGPRHRLSGVIWPLSEAEARRPRQHGDDGGVHVVQLKRQEGLRRGIQGQQAARRAGNEAKKKKVVEMKNQSAASTAWWRGSPRCAANVNCAAQAVGRSATEP